MALVNFKKGLRAGLPATYSEGTFYVTTDERAIYLDVSNEARIRLGDFQEFATLDALTANTNPSTTALYYVSDINCLAKWNGSEYVQINKDTGMTKVEVTGEGNAVTAAVYDAANRKLTLTKGATYMTAADVDGKIDTAKTEIMDYVGDIPEGYTEDTVIAYINKKAEETLNAASGGSSESAASVLAALNTYKSENDPKVEANTAAAAAAQSAAEAAQATADSKVTMAEVEAKDYATKTEAQGYADAKDTAIAAAKAAGDAAQADVDALAGKVGEVPADKTVVQMIADAQSAATYDDTQVKADIAANAGEIATIKGDYLKAADKTELSGAIQAEADRAAAAEKVNADAIAAVKEDLDAFLLDADVSEKAVDTLKEIQAYITTDGEAAAALTQDVADNKAAIEAEVKRAGEAESALSGRLDTLEAIDHDAYIAADTQVLTDAKAHANGLNDAMDARVKELEAIEHHSHSNMDVLNGITAAKVSAWDSAESNAASALAEAKTELEGKITAEENRAKGIENDHEGRIAAIEGDYLKAAAKTELEGKITTETNRATAAEEALAGRVATLEGIDHEAYKGYADQAEADAIASANAHAESLMAWGSF